MWDKAKKGRCRRGKWEDPKLVINHVGLKHWSTWTVRACRKMLKAKYFWTSKGEYLWEGLQYPPLLRKFMPMVKCLVVDVESPLSDGTSN